MVVFRKTTDISERSFCVELNGNGVKLKYPWLKSMNFKNDAELKRERESTINLSIRCRIRPSGEN